MSDERLETRPGGALASNDEHGLRPDQPAAERVEGFDHHFVAFHRLEAPDAAHDPLLGSQSELAPQRAARRTRRERARVDAVPDGLNQPFGAMQPLREIRSERAGYGDDNIGQARGAAIQDPSDTLPRLPVLGVHYPGNAREPRGPHRLVPDTAVRMHDVRAKRGESLG